MPETFVSDAIKLGKELEAHDRNQRTLQQQIDAKTAELKAITKEANSKSKQIIQEAKNEANAIVKAAEDIDEEAQERLSTAIAREKASAWVKESEDKLKVREKAVKQREEAAEKAKIEFLVQKDLYAEHNKTVETTIKALMEREAKITKREQELRLSQDKPSTKIAEKKPAPKKKAK